jgi:hypothetical protein
MKGLILLISLIFIDKKKIMAWSLIWSGAGKGQVIWSKKTGQGSCPCPVLLPVAW